MCYHLAVRKWSSRRCFHWGLLRSSDNAAECRCLQGAWSMFTGWGDVNVQIFVTTALDLTFIPTLARCTDADSAGVRARKMP